MVIVLKWVHSKGTTSFHVPLFIKMMGFLHWVKKQPINNNTILLIIYIKLLVTKFCNSRKSISRNNYLMLR
ncbi:MAG TPA: hypothetical protein DEF18_12570 [Muricauda sp.]|nr:hypothetical protein [Allomuricauda sp.]